MNTARKVTCTFEIGGDLTPEEVGEEAAKRVRAIRIKTAMLQRSHSAAMYGRELGTVRSHITMVINGDRKSKRVRTYIEKRLGMELWG